MFGIRSSQAKTSADPLQSRRTAMAWFGQLPALDVLARVALVTQALDVLRQTAAPIDRDRLAAIGYLDGAIESDLHRLIAWYLEQYAASPAPAARLWQAALELNRAFVDAYQAVVDPACAQAEDARWRPLLPLLIAELMRCHGTDLKLRLFQRQHWIPANWAHLHGLFRRANEIGIERVAAAPDSVDPLAGARSIEQEYLYVLLLQLLDTGNLTASEVQWAANQLLVWSSDLTLDTVAWTADGFYVDLMGSSGLMRRRGQDQGRMLGYVDTTLLGQRLDAALARARSGSGPAAEAGPASIETLEKLLPALAPKRDTDYRRHPRSAMDVAATISSGLTAIWHSLATQEASSQRNADAGSTIPAAFAALRFDAAKDEPLPWPGDDQQHAMAPLSPDPSESDGNGGSRPPPGSRVATPATRWRVKDTSASGWRMAGPGASIANLALGMLVAAKLDGGSAWMLGVVRRVNDRGKGELDAGVALIAERVVSVTLYAHRHKAQDMGVVVDGVETAMIGARFNGLYLLPAPGAKAVTMRSLILPTAEYAEGRRLVLVTGRSDYAIVLRHVIERRADWSWVTVQIANRVQKST